MSLPHLEISIRIKAAKSSGVKMANGTDWRLRRVTYCSTLAWLLSMRLNWAAVPASIWVAAVAAPNLETLFATRVLAGIGSAAFLPSASLVVLSTADPAKRVRSLALMYSGMNVAQLLGIPVATYLGEAFGWRWGFALGIIPTLLALALVWLLALAPALKTLRQHDIRSAELQGTLTRMQALQAQAEATLASAQAQETFYGNQATRYTKLAKEGIVSQEQSDQANVEARARRKTSDKDAAAPVVEWDEVHASATVEGTITRADFGSDITLTEDNGEYHLVMGGSDFSDLGSSDAAGMSISMTFEFPGKVTRIAWALGASPFWPPPCG